MKEEEEEKPQLVSKHRRKSGRKEVEGIKKVKCLLSAQDTESEEMGYRR